MADVAPPRLVAVIGSYLLGQPWHNVLAAQLRGMDDQALVGDSANWTGPFYGPAFFTLDTPRPYSVPRIHTYSRTVPPRVLRPRTASRRKRLMDGPRWPQRGYRR